MLLAVAERCYIKYFHCSTSKVLVLCSFYCYIALLFLFAFINTISRCNIIYSIWFIFVSLKKSQQKMYLSSCNARRRAHTPYHAVTVCSKCFEMSLSVRMQLTGSILSLSSSLWTLNWLELWLCSFSYFMICILFVRIVFEASYFYSSSNIQVIVMIWHLLHWPNLRNIFSSLFWPIA